MGRRRSSPANMVFGWIQRQSMKAKIAMGVVTGILLLVAFKLFMASYYYFFLLSSSVHAVGILVLIYKLSTKKTCSGLSLKSQEVTAMFLIVRLYCSFNLQPDVHMLLDLTTLILTIWVMYMIRYKLKSSYNKDLDNLPLYYVVLPSFVLAIFVHPYMREYQIGTVLWAFCCYLEAVSVWPQLRLMQNAKMAEPFTAHYIFALGVARFIGCAHWIIMIIETRGTYLHFWGFGSIWMLANLIAEIVQTFILGDFCYYYVKGVMAGRVSLPLPV